jgi:hypothetical protein
VKRFKEKLKSREAWKRDNKVTMSLLCESMRPMIAPVAWDMIVVLEKQIRANDDSLGYGALEKMVTKLKLGFTSVIHASIQFAHAVKESPHSEVYLGEIRSLFRVAHADVHGI